ncbi:MAG: 30S ribosomal protein S8 [Mariprofundaceae bacterium]
MMTDPIADMLTRIRNAQQAGLEKLEMPASNLLVSIALILKDEGYIVSTRSFNHKGHRHLRLTLRYDVEGKAAIREIQRVSTPGRRVYAGADKLPRERNGYGITIISTSKGLMTDAKARAARVGGEVLCRVF